MATLNLGRIKPVFRGAWTSGAFVIDDIVTHGNETFICIQAGSNIATTNASYWTKLAAKGTDGTDVGTTITTQGDILYRDGSGLARLPAGTSGQVLKTGGSGANPSWGTDSGGSILAISHKTTGNTYNINTQNRTATYNFTGASYEISELSITMTPSASTSKFMINCNLQGGHTGSYVGMGWLTYQVSGGTEYGITSSNTRGLTFRYDGADFTTSNMSNPSIACCVITSPSTTSA